MKAAGYEIATTDWLDRFDAFYRETYPAYEKEVEECVAGVQDFYRILGLAGKFDHPTGIPVTDVDIESSATDTAIYVLARQAGEGNDREDVNGDYRLDVVELENLRKVAAGYEHMIVVINAGGVIDVSFLEEIPVAALVYFVQGGEEGGNAFADVISGKENFSGKLATSWAYRFSDIPSNTTYSYLGKDKYNQEYNEGIYAGYRFFDTFGVAPRYHFGYGLSYTDFALDVGRIWTERVPGEKALGASGSTTAELYEDCGIPNVICSGGPAGLNLTSQIVEMPDGSVKAAKVQENLEVYRRYLFGFAKIALSARMADPSADVLHYQYATAWPCSQLLAQSFNVALLEEIGDAVGKEMEEYGVTVWLAPGMNIHRNPLCGRTFKYYSEDPLVSGKMAAAIVRGVQSHPGKGMSVKHFVANNCELERNSSSSNMNERALRELYLKGFEIAVKETEPRTVMASYNMVNGVHATNNYDLLVKVLRNEWGFEGLVMSDWDSIKADREDCLKAETSDITKAHSAQCDLVMPGRPDQVEALTKGVEQGLVQVEDLKRSAARIRILRLVRGNMFCESR